MAWSGAPGCSWAATHESHVALQLTDAPFFALLNPLEKLRAGIGAIGLVAPPPAEEESVKEFITRSEPRNPGPSTLNPQPSTLNPQPSTLNPQPPTLHPTPTTQC